MSNSRIQEDSKGILKLSFLKTENRFATRSECIVLPFTYCKFMSQSKSWCFTWNNPTLSAAQVWHIMEDKGATYLVFQRERGEHGTAHYQGYVEFKTRKLLTGLKKVNNEIHWEVRRGSQAQAIAYVQKDDTRIKGPWEHGEKAITNQGKRSDLEDAAELVRNSGVGAVAEEMPSTFIRYGAGLARYALTLPMVQAPDAPSVILLYGPPGCGKTRYYMDGETSPVIVDCSNGYWFDGYNGGPHALLDDFDGKFSKWPLKGLLAITDRYSRLVPNKGGFVCWRPQRIYITTNIHPSNWYDFTGRTSQYAALQRRITEVIWWKYNVGEPQTPGFSIDPDTEQWKLFWDKPFFTEKEYTW